MNRTQNSLNRSFLHASRALHIVLAGVVLVSISSPVYADQYDDKIKAIRQGIEAKRSTVNQLKTQQNTLANTLASINAQIDETTAQLELTQARFDKTTADMETTKRQIADKKAMLGENLVVGLGHARGEERVEERRQALADG